MGWLATAVFLELNDHSMIRAHNDDVYDLVIEVAATTMALDEIATGLQRLPTRG